MTTRQLHKLKSLHVSTLAKPGRHADGGGLYLAIDKSGRRRWVFLYRFAGKRPEMGLGAASGPDAVSLADARSAAACARDLLSKGIDPLAHRNQRQVEQDAERLKQEQDTATPTFGDYADNFVATHEASWRNDKHRAQWKMTLTHYCAPIRSRRIDQIDTEAALSVLKPIWTKRPETAQRLRGRMERVLDAAKVEGFRSGENPAAWRGHLAALLPKRQKLTRGHHAALPYDRMPEFMDALRAMPGTAARLLEFCILTATRSGEAFGAEWSEIDFDKAMWTIPAARMKVGREHRVPLSERAITVLEALHRTPGSRFVFPGAKKDRPLSNMAMAKVLERMGYDDFTVHGFRSTFRDWAAETTGFPHEVCEMALAHTIANKAEAAYRRGDLLEKRRELMKAWAAHCWPKADNVVALRRAVG